MKKILVMLIIVAALGGWWWHSNRQAEKARIEMEKQQAADKAAKEKAENERLTAEKIRLETEAAVKAKALAEAKAKADAEAEVKRLAEEKARQEAADPVKQLAKLEEDLRKTDQEWHPYKNQLQELRNINRTTPETQTFDTGIQQQARASQQQLKAVISQIVDCNNAINKAQAGKKRVETGLNAGGNKKDKYSGWYYVESPSYIYPMSDLDNRNHNRRIAYVSKKENVKAEAVAEADKEIAKLQATLSGLQKQRTLIEQQYQGLQQQLSTSIDNKRQMLLTTAKPVLTQRKDLRTKIAVLKKSSSDKDMVATLESED